jgi:hypothetical protein
LVLSVVSTPGNTFSVNSGFTESYEQAYSGGVTLGGLCSRLIQGAAAAVNPTTSWLDAGEIAGANAVFSPSASGTCVGRFSLLGAGGC